MCTIYSEIKNLTNIWRLLIATRKLVFLSKPVSFELPLVLRDSLRLFILGNKVELVDISEVLMNELWLNLNTSFRNVGAKVYITHTEYEIIILSEDELVEYIPLIQLIDYGDDGYLYVGDGVFKNSGNIYSLNQILGDYVDFISTNYPRLFDSLRQ